MQEEQSKENKDGCLDAIAGYGTIMAGSVLGSAAHHSPKLRQGLEELVTGNFDNITQTIVDFAHALPLAIDKECIYGVIGTCAAKLLIDGYYGLRKIAGKTKNKVIELFSRATLYFTGLTAGVAYAKNPYVFKDIINNAPGWTKEVIHAATNMQTVSMAVGIAGVTAVYELGKCIGRKVKRRKANQDFDKTQVIIIQNGKENYRK